MVSISIAHETRRHPPVEHVCVADNCSNLGVTISTLRPFIDVRATNDSQPIIHDANLDHAVLELRPIHIQLITNLAMDVDLLSSQHVAT